jgi:mandelamide amidase
LHGIPLAIKDCIDVAGLATTGGTPALRDHVANRTAPLVQKLKDAGAIVFGKTNMYELAFGITSNNAFTGPVKNPHDLTRSAGGSSSGSAAAVAAGYVPGAIGTDTAGSVRIPASHCGIFGFRPSSKRYDSSGVMPLFPTRDVPGLMARSVKDLQLMDAVLSCDGSQPNVDLPSLRLGLPGPYFLDELETGVTAAFEDMLAQLKSCGVTIVDAALHDLARSLDKLSDPIRAWELPRSLAEYLETSGAGIGFDALIAGIAGPYVREEFADALREANAEDLAKRYRHVVSVALPGFRKKYLDHFKEFQLDAIIFPTTPILATALGEEGDVLVDNQAVSVWRTMRNTVPASFFGTPGLTFPSTNSVQGLPVGVEIDGLPGKDRKVLAMAAAMEARLLR